MCGKEDSHGCGRALRWHTTRRNADDRTAPARSVRHAVPRNTPRRSQLRRLTQSMSYRRRHWCWQQFAAVCGHPHPRCRRRRPSLLLYATDAIIANLVRKLHNCSNRESVHCLDVYTRSLFMSIVHRPSETDAHEQRPGVHIQAVYGLTV